MSWQARAASPAEHASSSRSPSTTIWRAPSCRRTTPLRRSSSTPVMRSRSLLPACLDAEGQAIADVLADLGAPPCLPPSVKYADLVLRATERRDLHPPHDDAWTGTTQASSLAPPIQPLAPIVAKHLFLDRYYELRPETDPERFGSVSRGRRDTK